MKKWAFQDGDAASSASKRARFKVDAELATSARRTSSSKCEKIPEDGEDCEDARAASNLRILCYSSPKMVHDTLSSLSPDVVEVIKELGMEGMMKVPRILLMDRQFSFWLLNRVNPEFLSLQLGNGTSISIDEKSVELVLGVCRNGAEIPREPKKWNSYVVPAVAKVLRLPEGTRHIIAGDLSDVIERGLPENPTEEDKDMIRAAVVLFYCTHLLAPRERASVIPKDALVCAMHPRTLKDYNWAKYIIEIIRDSAEKLHEDVASERKTFLLGGCLLYLQVSTFLILFQSQSPMLV